ncbi:MAG: DUF4340 domain-containing protein [Myxococcales bacterium]|nr:DUF4340 domain-containing protein [Myxococcales bacterium]
MTARAPIVLALIVVSLAGYVFFFERDRPGRAEIEARAGFLVQSLVHDRISRIHISTGDEHAVISRHGEDFDETWTLEQPVVAAADPGPVEDYLRDWEFAIATRTLEKPSPEDVQNFGLDTPKASVRFEMGRAEVTVSLGSSTPVDGGGYVRIDDRDQVMVVPKSVVELFDLGAEHFRIKNDAGAPDLADLLDAEVRRDAAAP